MPTIIVSNETLKNIKKVLKESRCEQKLEKPTKQHYQRLKRLKRKNLMKLSRKQ